MHKASGTIGALMLAGCGHFLTPLGNVQPQDGKTPQEQEAARSECTDQSRASVENPQTTAMSTAAGLAHAAAPTIAYLQATRKRVFRECMAAKGYTVNQTM